MLQERKQRRLSDASASSISIVPPWEATNRLVPRSGHAAQCSTPPSTSRSPDAAQHCWYAEWREAPPAFPRSPLQARHRTGAIVRSIGHFSRKTTVIATKSRSRNAGSSTSPRVHDRAVQHVRRHAEKIQEQPDRGGRVLNATFRSSSVERGMPRMPNAAIVCPFPVINKAEHHYLRSQRRTVQRADPSTPPRYRSRSSKSATAVDADTTVPSMK